MTTIGLLHPGEMGASVGRAARANGHRVLWASEGRGPDTAARAAGAGLEDAGTLRALGSASDVVLSVCPPHAAGDVARAVAAAGFRGLYVDGNAVAPATARALGTLIEKAGATFVDGGIVGPPPDKPGTTRLYLSGPAAARVAELFTTGPLEAIVLPGELTSASAVKMAYAAWNKGQQALIMAVRALATAEGVDETLVAEWQRSQPDLPKRSENAARGSARKAWRWVGEMDEIAAAFAAAGLPDGFHRAAGEVYRRLSPYKDAAAPPTIEDVAKTLRKEPRP
ncbi:MAG: NAD(P)-dependent oxidoreductase [Candidatus Rokuibacteriota bacterium]|nr:MAG: NAD(P)-dependent oxidoreductase [Candidatus Rokubacteria bacterium]